MGTRIVTIREVIFHHRVRFLLLVLLFYGFNFLVNKNYVFYASLGSVRLWFAFSFIVLNFLLSLFFALVTSLLIQRYQQTRIVETGQGSLAAIGFFGAALGSGCPACFTGLLPALIGFFGLTLSFGNLPFLGLGIQVVSLVFLGYAIYLLSGPVTCKIPLPTKKSLKR